MQKSPCLRAVSRRRVCCRWKRGRGRPRGKSGALRDVRGRAGGYHCAIGRAERRGGRVVLYGSYEDGERLERVTKLWVAIK
jgi:hypothetical protein